MGKKKTFLVFVNSLQILPISQILFLFLFSGFENYELFLFLFVKKLAPRIYSYSYSQGKLLFADHWFVFVKRYMKRTASKIVSVGVLSLILSRTPSPFS